MIALRTGYTLVELIVIILLIAIGTTLVLSIHTKLQRDALDVKDESQVREIQQKLAMYAGNWQGQYPSVEGYISDPDRATRFSDFRQRPAKALRLLFRHEHGGSAVDYAAEQEGLRLLYSPMDGAMPKYVLDIMLKNSSLTDKDTMCFSSYAYDPGHRKPDPAQRIADDGSTVIFGHSPSFLLRHGRTFSRVITANGQIYNLYLKNDRKAYELEVHIGGSKPQVVLDDIYQDQVDVLFNRDSYLSDAIPLAP